MVQYIQTIFPSYAFWADTLSLIGFVVTVFGFLFTFSKISKAKKEIKNSLIKFDVVSDLTFAISKVDEVRRLQRAQAWEVLPERYSELRKLVSSVKSSGVNFIDIQHADMQNAISHFANIERTIERALEKKEPLKGVSKINGILSDQSDNLNKILIEIKARTK